MIRQSGLFDENWYLQTYKDVANAKIDPLYHFMRAGGFEGRYPSLKFNITQYIEIMKGNIPNWLNPLVHYLITQKMPYDIMNLEFMEKKINKIRYRNRMGQSLFEDKLKSVLKARYGINILKSPVLHSSEIKNIVIFKLDHIGDFQISLEAIQRLKTILPQSNLHLVCGPWIKGLAEKTKLFTTVTTFDFFDEKQSRPELNPFTVDIENIKRILEPLKADIAVDLRYNPETRFLLPLTDAPITIGYESHYYIPDICLPVDSIPLKLGRTHNATYLNRLISEIPIVNIPIKKIKGKAIGIHAGTSQKSKTWPHMKELAELLIESGYLVYQYGPSGDVLLSDKVVNRIGDIELDSYAEVVSDECKLYIGQDTGTTHLVAATGLTTIGIYGGFVDPYEWMPRSPNSYVLYNDIECAPCYNPKCKWGDVRCLGELMHEGAYYFISNLFKN